MQIYRASEGDVVYLTRLLDREALPYEIDRYGSDATYVKIKSSRPDIPRLAKSAGRSVRRVLDLTELSLEG